MKVRHLLIGAGTFLCPYNDILGFPYFWGKVIRKTKVMITEKEYLKDYRTMNEEEK